MVNIIFRGDPPIHNYPNALGYNAIIAYYPAANEKWKWKARHRFQGDITWIAN